MKNIHLYILWIVLIIITLFPIYWMFLVSARDKLEVLSSPKPNTADIL